MHVALRVLGTIYIVLLMITTWVVTFVIQAVAYVPCRLFLDKYQQMKVLGLIFRVTSGLVCWLNPMWRLTRVKPLKAQPGRAIVMCNHLSNCDPFIMAASLFPFETKYIAKGVLFNVPFGGWAMGLAGDVPVYFTSDKGGWGTVKGSVKKMMETCRELLDHNIPLMVFPEGARSRSGRMQTFKDGFFQFAAENGIDIIPVAVNGSQRAWSPGDWKMNYANIYFTSGETIKVSKGCEAVALRESVRSSIVSLYKSLPGADPQYETPDPEDLRRDQEREAKAKAQQAKSADSVKSN